MWKEFFKSNIAIIGGGNFCKNLLEVIYDSDFDEDRPTIIGIADLNLDAEGMRLARQLNIPTSADYHQFFKIPDLQMIMELTPDFGFSAVISREVPDGIKLIDHIEARSIWSSLQLEKARRDALKELHANNFGEEDIDRVFNQFADRLGEVIRARGERYSEIERNLKESERALSQIIEGSTIPTFVLKADHVVSHWNKAMQRLTGASSESMVGTKNQSKPFWGEERPTMADVILDQVEEEEIQRLYGEKWRKSALIEGAYEAEVFFPHLGDEGKWCWFTAAPLKSRDGRIVGAIETLWDKTEDHKAEEERERYTGELSTLCSIYTALNAPSDLNLRIQQSVMELIDFLNADGLCIYLADEAGNFVLRHSEGLSEKACRQLRVADENSVIQRVAKNNEYIIHEDLPDGCIDEICRLEEEPAVSLAYIPISTKEKGTFGVIRIGSHKPNFFRKEQKNVLELIGNRIGVAIENAELQEQYIKSEQKYRTLFNSDPHPIFILDSQTFEILDLNERAQASYGYERSDLLGTSFLKLGEKTDTEVPEALKTLSKEHSNLITKKRHYRVGGQPFFVNINMSSAKYDGSDVIIASTTDITEVVEKETQLIQAGKMTTLGVMAAGMAHEINQPLNVIQVCADFLLKMTDRGQTISDEDMRTMANDIVANVERASGVIKHVRDFARQSELVKSRVNINDPINDVFKVLGHQVKSHTITVDLELDPDIPDIMAEHNRLEQVFINLVSNAIDAMDEKADRSAGEPVEKHLSIKSSLEGGQVVVRVSDTGIGMSEEVQQKIFEPFFTTKKVGKGTGLGFSISYGIVEDYDGTIDIDSEVGRGTTFTLRFPAAEKAN